MFSGRQSACPCIVSFLPVIHCDGRLTSLFLVDYCCIMLTLWLVICQLYRVKNLDLCTSQHNYCASWTLSNNSMSFNVDETDDLLSTLLLLAKCFLFPLLHFFWNCTLCILCLSSLLLYLSVWIKIMFRYCMHLYVCLECSEITIN